MDVLLGFLFSILERLFMIKIERKSPKQELCQNLVRFRNQLIEFKQVLTNLASRLSIELEPLLVFDSTSTLTKNLEFDFTSFSSKDVRVFKDYLSRQNEALVQDIVQKFNRLNTLRDEIFDLITKKAIPIERLGIFFPEFERAVWIMIAVDRPGDSYVGSRTHNPYDDVSRRMNDKKISLHSRFMWAINSSQSWKSYILELQWSSDQIVKLIGEIETLIRANCKLEEAL